jgi:hypothetical protein
MQPALHSLCVVLQLEHTLDGLPLGFSFFDSVFVSLDIALPIAQRGHACQRLNDYRANKSHTVADIFKLIIDERSAKR